MQNKFEIYSCHKTNDGRFIYQASYGANTFAITTNISNSSQLTTKFFAAMHETDVIKIQNIVISQQLDMATLLMLFFNDFMPFNFSQVLSDPSLLIPKFLQLLEPVGYKQACQSPNFIRDAKAICLGYYRKYGRRSHVKLQKDILKYCPDYYKIACSKLIWDSVYDDFYGKLQGIHISLGNAGHAQVILPEIKNMYVSERERIKAILLKQVYWWAQDELTLKIYVANNFSMETYTLHFNQIDSIYRKDTQNYIKNAVKQRELPSKINRRFQLLTRGLSCLKKKQFTELKQFDIRALIQDLNNATNSAGERRFGRKSVQLIHSELCVFFDYLIETKYQRNISNPFRLITVPGSDRDVISHKPIPVEVVDMLFKTLPKYDYTVYVLFYVLMSTGARIGDAVNLTVNDLLFDKELQQYFLRYYIRKTSQKSSMHGETSLLEIPISDDLADCIKQIIRQKASLRKLSHSDLVFISQSNSRMHAYNAANINYAVRQCIKENNITYQGELYQFNSHQCRKTLATELLSNGTSIEDVSHILGHSTPQTTLQYYHDIRDQKLAGLDQEVFKMFVPLNKRSYSRNTRRISLREANLIKESFILEANPDKIKKISKDGQGFCARPENLAPCAASSCLNCPLLLTGVEKIETWKKLAQQQEEILATMSKTNSNYQQQATLLVQYKAIIGKILSISGADNHE